MKRDSFPISISSARNWDEAWANPASVQVHVGMVGFARRYPQVKVIYLRRQPRSKE